MPEDSAAVVRYYAQTRGQGTVAITSTQQYESVRRGVELRGYGLYSQVEYTAGPLAGFALRFGHQGGFNTNLITEGGAPVQAGQPVGFVGSTGTSSGNHLHAELRVRTRPHPDWPRSFTPVDDGSGDVWVPVDPMVLAEATLTRADGKQYLDSVLLNALVDARLHDSVMAMPAPRSRRAAPAPDAETGPEEIEQEEEPFDEPVVRPAPVEVAAFEVDPPTIAGGTAIGSIEGQPVNGVGPIVPLGVGLRGTLPVEPPVEAAPPPLNYPPRPADIVVAGGAPLVQPPAPAN